MRHCEATPGHTAILIPSLLAATGQWLQFQRARWLLYQSTPLLFFPQLSSVAAFGNNAQTLLDFGSHVLTQLLLFHFSRRKRFHDQ